MWNSEYSIISVFSVQISDDPFSEMDRFENNFMCVIDLA